MGRNWCRDLSDEDKSLKEIMKYAYIWAMWISINDSIFNGEPFNSIGVGNAIKYLVKMWYSTRGSKDRCRVLFEPAL